MSKYIMLAAALVCTAASAYLTRGQQVQPPRAPRQSRVLFLEGHLLRLGEEYDVYFTLETAWGEGESSNWMENHRVAEPPRHDGLQRELERLRQSVPHFTYASDETNPRIVHVIDARLAGQNGYGLSSVIKGINYRGTIAGLVNTLSERGVKVSGNRLTLIGDSRSRDYETEVRVVAQNITVRDAITNFIPPEGRRRILWVSATKLGAGQVSQIDFYGGTRKLQ